VSTPLSDQTALYWFNDDLRLDDNIALDTVIRQSDRIALIYVFNPFWLTPKNYQQRFIGQHRLAFIVQSLLDLESQLKALGHTLHILEGDPLTVIPPLARDNGITLVGTSTQLGWHEAKIWEMLQQRLPDQKIVSQSNNQLYTTQLLFGSTRVDNNVLMSFSKFRTHIQRNAIGPLSYTKTMVQGLPTPIALRGNFETIADLQSKLQNTLDAINCTEHDNKQPFVGGEKAAQTHLESYFSGDYPSSYRSTRNELDGWRNSTKLSPYLANGNISPRQVWTAVENFEKSNIKNDDTYWIKFELLWREYFHWLAIMQCASLYQFQGMASSRPLTTYLPERFQKWCHGNTPYALVNACMKQLNATGYMSNRGRQITASCLVNELGVDWRYGAAYFQDKLIDHDVASNWGNWRYIAGVGADPRGGRHFNLTKQMQSYDPNGEFVAKWQGTNSSQPLDSVDAVGWPCQPISNTPLHSNKLKQ
jgi:deoxyribodipyrimidine photo-lyase